MGGARFALDQAWKVYVSRPPVVVPFIVMTYSQLFGAEYIYHLQDIHPEGANAVIPVNKWIYKLLLKMDALSMRKAARLITITARTYRNPITLRN